MISTEQEMLKAKSRSRSKKTKVYISGTWDLFHIGHLNAIKKAKEMGDELIVGISTDELIRKYKNHAPVFPYKDRFEIIQSLKYIDKIVTQQELSTVEQFKDLDFDILVVGDDWKDQYLEGIEWIKNHSEKKVVFLPRTPGISTSIIKKRLSHA